ncbi:RagB/SusD family nutrient uptake outer membrane protein [Flagellimonas pacifica]|uniref:Starch-binding associating with outer membrane n=1 Tax=Flagellimonas pacifica TaxID=1247520 RepID=A0A285MCP6_9FLAO|nr:RagB/SusD family nutrient uptake outer membrane protein [Allomuricauda parva]SNY94858.1 Starch-binding associating with outer membrane [Allomuricauda parva]
MKRNIIVMKINKLLLLIISILTLTGCSDQLDLQPLDRLTVDTFYNTRSDFDGAIFASYSSIQDFWGTSTETLSERGEFWKITTMITDDLSANNLSNVDQAARDADALIVRAADKPYASIYTQIYEGIYRANLVLANLDGENELTAEDKTVLGAEAKFLRAWFHFQALKLFGTPPLAMEIITDINSQALPNSTQADLYTAILADLGEAASGLPVSWDSGNTGRATSWAARSVMGKVKVFQEDWAGAITDLGNVVDSGPYSLMPNYSDNFSFLSENNSESIFEIQFGGPFSDDNIWVFDDTHSEDFKASQGTGRAYYWEARVGLGAPGRRGLGWYVPTQDLIDAYEPGDSRLAVTVIQEGEMYYAVNGGATVEAPFDAAWSDTGATPAKYFGQENANPSNYSPNLGATFNNERWFRFAELKLLYAEALIRGSGDQTVAEQQINDIRNRAGLPDLAPGSDLLAAMMQEKRVELAMEPHRWFDIVRWDIGAAVFGGDWDPKLEVFPFPLSEIDRSNGLLNQNSGY